MVYNKEAVGQEVDTSPPWSATRPNEMERGGGKKEEEKELSPAREREKTRNAFRGTVYYMQSTRFEFLDAGLIIKL